MMGDSVFWVWAQQVFGEGSAMPWYIHQNFPGGLEGFYRSGPRCWNALDYITEQQAASLVKVQLEAARTKLEYVKKLGWSVVTPECEKYPGRLRNISDPPAVLYRKGRMPDCENLPVVAVVGARQATEESVDFSRAIGFQLASGGAVVVSGGALGVDGAVLSGVISALGTGMSILPVDLDSPYLVRNMHLRSKLLETGGVLLSEYFSQRDPGRGSFHQRNRLITGFSHCVVLVQAGEKSGTMIYARHALKQGRPLFVYPGPAGAPEFAGSRRLIREGARPVSSGWEILEYLSGLGIGAAPAADRDRESPEERTVLPLEREDGPEPEKSLSALLADSKEQAGHGEQVLKALETGAKTIDELEDQTGLEAGELLGILTQLELEGRVETGSGQRYSRKPAGKGAPWALDQ